MTEDQIGKQVVDAAIQIHRNLGPGLFESVYEAVMASELQEHGLKLGFLLNFSVPLMKEGIVRIVNGLEENLGVLASSREIPEPVPFA